MSQNTYPIPKDTANRALINNEQYLELYQASLNNPETFWRQQSDSFLHWQKDWSILQEGSFSEGDVRWFSDGLINVSENCIDRHLKDKASQTAIIWEADEPGQARHISYQELHDKVCQMANALKASGVHKGDRVCIYLPMIPEAAYAMLACARIGAVHSIVFAGFSPEALKDRIQDADCSTIITADAGIRGGKTIPLKHNVDEALLHCPSIKHCFVVKHIENDINWVEGRDIDYHEATQQQASRCPCEPMLAEDPLFILYTSGSTGKPKGVLHTTGGYLLGASMTHRYIFDCQEGDVYWCTADVGWITGHSYIIYGPLCNGVTTLMFEGVPTYPNASRFWQVIDEHQVNIFYTAPTAIRALMAQGDEPVTATSRSSLRLLGSVGEPINPEAWLWYHKVVGEERCPIVDTWWQTETGSIMISPLPGATETKPGSATRPSFGVELALLDTDGNELEGAGEGFLAIKRAWPSQIRSIYGNHERMLDGYFNVYKGYYFTGDGARRDEDGYYWITGRVDDILNVSGHRLGTAEIESALVLHPKVAEAAVVGFPHDIKGQAIYAYVTLMKDAEHSDTLHQELVDLVNKEISAMAKPDVIQWTPELPKTRSGKIMRRILRKIACKEFDTLGDTSTLAAPAVVQELIEQRKNQ